VATLPLPKADLAHSGLDLHRAADAIVVTLPPTLGDTIVFHEE
jgi:hypothetical protein